MVLGVSRRLVELAGLENNFCDPELVHEFPCNMESWQITGLSLIGALICISMCVFLKFKLDAFPRGNEKMVELSDMIASGARSFLRTEYYYLAQFCFVVAVVLVLLFTLSSKRVDDTDGIRVAGCFLGGAILSACAGWVGMVVATDANAKTTEAARAKGLNESLKVAFSGGAVMGFCVVGLGLAGVSIFLMLMTAGRSADDLDDDAMAYPHTAQRYMLAASDLAGFGFGASAIALFARVTGGIYTKAADVGADLVGKVEKNIPEDDPRNPATIADNVGDNVGDVAGMGADLFESFVGSIIATVTLAKVFCRGSSITTHLKSHMSVGGIF